MIIVIRQRHDILLRIELYAHLPKIIGHNRRNATKAIIVLKTILLFMREKKCTCLIHPK